MFKLDTAKTIPQLLESQSTLGNHMAVIDADKRVTYAQLLQSVKTAAKAYMANGLSRGDRVAIWAPNRLEFILALLGAQYIGAIVVPLNTRYTGREAVDILSRSGSRILLTWEGFLGKSFSGLLRDASLAPDAPDLNALGLIINMGNVAAESCLNWTEFLATGECITDEELNQASEQVTADDVADILYTSGTTGVPKGVMSAQRQTIGVARAWAVGAELSQQDKYAVVNPFFHGFGYKAGMTTSLIAGATIYPVPVFDADELLELIQREKITVLPGVPTIFMTLIDHPRLNEYDLSSLRFAIAGATSAPDTLFHDMVNILGFKTVAQAYGLTECVVATMSRHGEDLDHVSQTTGPAIEETEIRLIDENGAEVPHESEGEILLRGANVMLGYFEDPEATAAAIDADGWFHTGDIGRLDEHGCLKITDRIKDMFIVGGFNVYPAEVESVLRHHPAVNESAVIGIPDDRLGAVGRGYVAFFHDAEPKPTSEELISFCKENLSNFKVPREIIIVEDFPRNAMGKILKTELRTNAS